MLIDSYSWVEFFQGSEKGKKVKEILESIECFTSIVSISEITEWCLKNNLDSKKFIKIVKASSEIIKIDEEIAELAGKVNFENKKLIKGWGMLDSLIYATAKLYSLKILTGDKHFSELENVEML